MQEIERLNQIFGRQIPEFSGLSPAVMQSIVIFANEQITKVKKLSEIGLALSAEKDLDLLLEKIIQEARHLTNADGGTLYILDEKLSVLRFAIVQNETLNIRMGGAAGPITWDPVVLFDPDGGRNYSNVSAYSALSREVINISDVYNTREFNFEGTRVFDARTGFRSRSMLVVPMQDHEDSIIGILQLLNAREVSTGQVIDFSPDAQQLTLALASQAAVAITNNRLISGLENLLESFVKTIAAAVDEKSPYTGGHIRRVADLTLAIANAVNNASEGIYKDISFNADELKEIRMAAWLHDVGKIVTPEQVVDKATRLEAIADRIELIEARFEIRKRDIEIALLKQPIETGGPEKKAMELEQKLQTLAADLDFIREVNRGMVPMTQENGRRLAAMTLADGWSMPLITDNELGNLSIAYGTLTEAERDIIQNHARVTARMLSGLPFPKKLLNVPCYAAAHHEKINGGGYPLGIGGPQLSLQARIIALADVFEALTARDRPYKQANSFSQSIRILRDMVGKGELDSDLLDLLLKDGALLEYARRELPPAQIDL